MKVRIYFVYLHMKINISSEKLEELISKGWKRKEIADFFQVSEKTISNKVKAYNLTFKKETKQKDVHTCKCCGKQYYISKYHPYCSKQCAGKISKDTFVQPTTELGKRIVELRTKGKTYSQICSELNCSKATVCYYCNPVHKEQKKEYKITKYDPSVRKLVDIVYNFRNRETKDRIRFENSDFKQGFRTRVSNFVTNWERYNSMKNKRFNYKDVLDYIGGWETTCYLTGRKLDLRKDDYEFDHIIPISKGGSCELDNLGVTCAIANRSKSNLSVEEYIQLCKEVLEYNGYKVEKL